MISWCLWDRSCQCRTCAHSCICSHTDHALYGHEFWRGAQLAVIGLNLTRVWHGSDLGLFAIFPTKSFSCCMLRDFNQPLCRKIYTGCWHPLWKLYHQKAWVFTCNEFGEVLHPNSMTSTLHAVSKVDSPPYLVLKLDSLEVLAMCRPVHREVKSCNALPHLQGMIYSKNPVFCKLKMKVILTV